MDGFFRYDANTAGSKGLVFIGDRVLVYRRDGKTDLHPYELDLPGGGPDPTETPYETFRREVKEEFGLNITKDDIVYVRTYPSLLKPGKIIYFPVAKFQDRLKNSIRFGEEGSEYMLLDLDDYLSRTDAWEVLQERARNYKDSLDS
jgi:8-oxo-dGTP diphosphatase